MIDPCPQCGSRDTAAVLNAYKLYCFDCKRVYPLRGKHA